MKKANVYAVARECVGGSVEKMVVCQDYIGAIEKQVRRKAEKQAVRGFADRCFKGVQGGRLYTYDPLGLAGLENESGYVWHVQKV